MTVTPQTKLADVLAEYPWLLDEAAKRDARLKLLRTLPGRALLRRATVEELSARANVPPQKLSEKIEELIAEHSEG